ncbi:MAG TPA: calcium-binding protein [Dehalococcoidia bacterium]|jgi:Ca2+-binding RTX toxin-like protein|nr:calcium-binding protein [Dehalococcoidia bacterium]
MTRRRWIGVSLSVLFVVTTITINSAFTASNSVAVSGAGLFAQSIDANALKPATCGGLNLTSIVAGDGDLSGSNSGDLIVGGPSAQSISGAGGNDCILGGAGDDNIDGGNGNDVIFGAAGADTLTGGNGNDSLYGGDGDDSLDGGKRTDLCFGESGTDSFAGCETESP